MLTDYVCERCGCGDVESFVDISSTPMRRIARGDPFPAVDVEEAILVCEVCGEDFGARVRGPSPDEFVTGTDRTIG